MKTSFAIIAVLLLGFGCTGNTKSPATQTQPVVQAAPDYQKMIIARVYIKPGMEDKFINDAKTIIESSNKEEGCLGYMLYQEPYEKTNFVFVEKYKNQAAVDAHFATDYFKEFGTKIADLISKPSEIKIIDIAAEK